MIVTLEEVKLWLRLEEDYTFEDNVLTLLINSAYGYLKNAITDFDNKIKDDTNLATAKMLIQLLVTSWYENRAYTGTADDKIRPIVQSIIYQLEWANVSE